MTEPTIREIIHAAHLNAKKVRLGKLTDLGAPRVIIETLESEIEAGDSGVEKIKGISQYGDLIPTERIQTKYRHGNGCDFVTEAGVIKLIRGLYGHFVVHEKDSKK